MADRSHQYFSLRWNNYQKTLTSVFQQLREDQSFVDVTLSCERGSIKAHKVVLSACSTYFQKVFLDNPCKHPTVILPGDIVYTDLKTIVDFVYQGEIDVVESQLKGLLKTAEQLKIKGLCGSSEQLEESLDTLITIPVPEVESRNNFHGTFIGKARLSKRSKTPDTTKSTSTVNLNIPASASSAIAERGKNKESLNTNGKANKIIRTEGELNNGEANITSSPEAILAQIVVAQEKDTKNMTSLGMGINTGLLGAPISFLDFAPEPPAPAATPVTDNIDISTSVSVNDIGDLSKSGSPSKDVRIKFETLRSLDHSQAIDIVDHMSERIIKKLAQSPIGQLNNVTPPDEIKISNEIDIKTEIIEKHLLQDARSYHQLHSQTKLDLNHLDITTNTVMEIDSTNIKDEPAMVINPEIVCLMSTGKMDIYNSDTSEDSMMIGNRSVNESDGPQYTNLDQPDIKFIGPKTWTTEDMTSALEALKSHDMSLTKASITYGIPSTTLWQRAHRLGIDTPKKEGTTKSWNEESLNNALEALRTGQISANKASKTYGIPSSTLYKIARREGIRLAAPFNAAPTAWTPDDLERALEAIRSGVTSVQKASSEFGIPTGTLYGRCKREGIGLSRSNPTPWSEDAMNEALVAVRVGHMSINQAAIHYNLPYSSLYGRFKRGKYDSTSTLMPGNHTESSNNVDITENSLETSKFPHSEQTRTSFFSSQQHSSDTSCRSQQQSHDQQIHDEIPQHSDPHFIQQRDAVNSTSQVHSQSYQILYNDNLPIV